MFGSYIDCRTGSRACKSKAVVVEVPVHVGNKPPEILVLVTIDTVVRNIEEDGCEGIGNPDKIVAGGLANDGE